MKRKILLPVVNVNSTKGKLTICARNSFIASIIVGILLLYSILYSYFMNNRVESLYRPLINMTVEIKYELTQSHLWLEELLAGDQTKDLTKDIISHLDTASLYLKNIRASLINKSKKNTIDEEIEETIRNIDIFLKKERTLIMERYQNTIDSPASSQKDKLFDQIYLDAMNQLTYLKNFLNTLNSEARKTEEKISLFMLILIILLFVILISLIINSIKSKVLEEKLFNEKNREMEEFTYSIAHDLKSPVITIKGYTELLKEDIHSPELNRVDIAEDLHRIEKSTHRMLTLINQLMDLARIGMSPIKIEEVSLKKITEDALNNLCDSIRRKGAEIRIQGELPVVQGDAVRLLQVMQNLIDNALKFSRAETPPRIAISCSDGFIHVSDNGIGFPEEEKERIFKVCSRLNDSIEGSGIGLATVKKIVTSHGGKVTAFSAGMNKGATISFCLTNHFQSGKLSQ